MAFIGLSTGHFIKKDSVVSIGPVSIHGVYDDGVACSFLITGVGFSQPIVKAFDAFFASEEEAKQFLKPMEKLRKEFISKLLEK